MNRGLKLTKRSWKDLRFASHKLFGVAIAVDANYNVDSGTAFPDQNADLRPTECTAYLVTDSVRDHTGIEYSEDYNFMKTLEIMKVPPSTQGADLRSAFLVATSFGFLEKGKEPEIIKSSGQTFAATPANWPVALDSEAEKTKKSFCMITGPYDFSSNAQSFMWNTKDRKYTVGVGTTWFEEFEEIDSTGVLPVKPKTPTGGHAYKLCGWKEINGQPYWIVKSWQGESYGNRGYCYMPFSLMNQLMKSYGSAAYGLVDLDDETYTSLKQQKMNFTEVLIDIITNLIIALKEYAA